MKILILTSKQPFSLGKAPLFSHGPVTLGVQPRPSTVPVGAEK